MKKIIVIILATLTTGLVAGGLTTRNQGLAVDEPPFIQTLQNHSETLANHEARITNAEGNIVDLQNKTGTTSTNTVYVPQVVTPPATPTIVTPQPTPITVVKYEQIPIEGQYRIDCKFTYSDGTTKTWVWQTWEFNQGTKITHTSDKCDQSVIGRVKL